MIILLSPSKALNLEAKITAKNFTQPVFLQDSEILISELRKKSVDEISQLMKLSDKLSRLNFERYHDFKTPFNEENSKAALFIFDGDVYSKIEAEKYSDDQLNYAQNNLRILSGLYGILKPLDLMQAYRLEMSTKLKNERGGNLYEFWRKKLTDHLNSQKNDVIINLASQEYFGAINESEINAKIINVVFKEKKDGKYKIIGIFAKKARGMMANYMIKNKIENIEEIKKFNIDKYCFSSDLSDESNFVFCR